MVKALDRKLLRDLRRVWAQLLAAALVMAVGVGALSMSLSTLRSLQRAQDDYYERYRFPDVFAQVKRAPMSLVPRIADIPGVARAAARVVIDVNLSVPGLDEPAIGRLVSIPDSPPFGLAELHLRRGRFPSAGRTGEVIASEAFAEAHGMNPGRWVDAVINGRLQRLTIVGIALSPEYVYQIRPGDFIPDDRRFGVFWMRYDELAPAYGLDGAFNNVVLDLGVGASEPAVLDRLDALTEPYGGTGAITRTHQTSHQYLTDELGQLRGMAVIPPAIFLSAAAFILNIVMSRLVLTQREQIASLRAFGYPQGRIAGHYLKMVTVVACVGCTLGVLLGWRLGEYLTHMYARFFRFPTFEFSLDAWAVVLASGIGVASAVAGTLYAIRRATVLPPAEAMRPEPPTDYRSTVFERLRLHRVFTPTGRMIVRHLERQPMRAAMTSLGIALALAVLVMGGYTHGALEYLVYYQFQQTQRQDVTVTFVEPASANVTYELSRLPGVTKVEPFRAVPARLKAGHLERREGVQGLVTAPELSRVLDRSEASIAMPADGLLLSDAMADILRVRAGDVVTVEVLEGRRPTLVTKVTSVAPTYLGTGAYMAAPVLHRILEEGSTASGAFLRVDAGSLPVLLARLREAPRVASVVVKSAALRTFNETFARNILIMRLFNLVFASTIAVGIVFNSVRIALAERSHELATLRILGFERAEVTRMLLGEMGVLVAAAIPIGLVLGRLLTLYAATALRTETHRIPAIINPGTYAFAVVVIVCASMLSGLVVRRGIRTLNLVEVLKSKG